ncbi:hypothetical protein [Endozoicomonas ascidiicola]|uniref:hypothetical protein n=1 Tax=Endozoicomonas ascidiicola TaxID=1698521 RepID=UPI00082EC5E6|nr:hypothetical protein [Endozoicomonas ascidiicola]
MTSVTSGAPTPQPSPLTGGQQPAGKLGDKKVEVLSPGAVVNHMPRGSGSGGDPSAVTGRRVKLAPITDPKPDDGLYGQKIPDAVHGAEGVSKAVLERQQPQKPSHLDDDSGFYSEGEGDIVGSDDGDIPGTFKVEPPTQNFPSTKLDPKTGVLDISADPALAADESEAPTEAEKGFFKSALSNIGKCLSKIVDFAKKHKLPIMITMGIVIGLALMFASGGMAGIPMIGAFAVGYIVTTMNMSILLFYAMDGMLNPKDHQGANGKGGKDGKSGKDADKVDASSDFAKSNAAEDELKNGDVFKLHRKGEVDPATRLKRSEAEKISQTKEDFVHPFALDEFYEWVDKALGSLKDEDKFKDFKQEFLASGEVPSIEDLAALRTELDKLGLSLNNIKALAGEPLEATSHSLADQAIRMEAMDKEMEKVLAILRPKAKQLEPWLTGLFKALPKGKWLPDQNSLTDKFLSLDPERDRWSIPEDEIAKLEATDMTRNVWKALKEYETNLLTNSPATSAKPSVVSNMDEVADLIIEEGKSVLERKNSHVHPAQPEGVGNGEGLGSVDLSGDGFDFGNVKKAAKQVIDAMGDLVNAAEPIKGSGQDGVSSFGDDSPEELVLQVSHKTGSVKRKKSSRRSGQIGDKNADVDAEKPQGVKGGLEVLEAIAKNKKVLKVESFWGLFKNETGFDIDNPDNTKIKGTLILLGHELITKLISFDANPKPSLTHLHSADSQNAKDLMKVLVVTMLSHAKDILKAEADKPEGLTSNNKKLARENIVNSFGDNVNFKEKMSSVEFRDKNLKTKIPELLKDWVKKWNP